ncbi:hypothetical protein LIER_33334 [Lithospermum erythrorhizon]|uniref:Uncharacterized protein n=1 Tax=Lithospermum erythrorhizon TaxID=34254 RepID=A0AAV3S1N1_LITER
MTPSRQLPTTSPDDMSSYVGVTRRGRPDLFGASGLHVWLPLGPSQAISAEAWFLGVIRPGVDLGRRTALDHPSSVFGLIPLMAFGLD